MPADFITAEQAATLNNISARRVRQLAKAGRVPGAFKIGAGNRASWVIPTAWKYEPVPVGRPVKGKG